MDLQSVRCLAHGLYCQAQKQSNYKALARSIKKLRNELEDADEALSGTTFRPEDIRVLEAASESKNILTNLDVVLHQDEGAYMSDTDELDAIVADFIADLAVVTHKLTETIKDLEQAQGKPGLSSTATTRGRRRHLSKSTASPDEVSRQTSFRSSTTSRTSHDPTKPSPERSKMAAIVESDALLPASPSDLEMQTWSLGRGSLQILHQAPAPDSASAPLPTISRANTGNSSILDLYQTPPKSESARAPRSDYDRHTDLSAGTSTADLIDTRKYARQVEFPTALQPKDLHRKGRTFADGHAPLLNPHPPASYQSQQQTQHHAEGALPAKPHHHIKKVDANVPPPPRVSDDRVSSINRRAQLVTPRAPYSLMSSQSSIRQLHPNLGLEDDQAAGPSRKSQSSEALPTALLLASKLVAQEALPARSARLHEDDIRRALDSFNNKDWPTAELCLIGLLNQASGSQSYNMVRRIHHLLGVTASVQGRWQQALTQFLMVVRTPILGDSNLDEGDCSAAYWLGDTYCLLNRRAEALISYMIAEHSTLFRDTRRRQRILDEQKGCFPGPGTTSKEDWWRKWDIEAKKTDRSSRDSILNPRVLGFAAESLFLERAQVRAEAKKASKQQPMDQSHSRVMAFRVLGADAGSYELDYRLRVGSCAFDISRPWPLMFDPYFAVANVLRGRMLTKECDLLLVIRFDYSANVPKATRGLKTNFVAHDLRWLIVNIRECLASCNMTVSEVATTTSGPCFVARYAAVEKHIATMHFLTVSIFRQSFKSGFGVDIASDGLFSARIIRADWLYDKGVPCKETERIKAMILHHLETAAKCTGPAVITGDTDMQVTTRGRRKRVLLPSSRSSLSTGRPSVSSQ
ncbi:hypothetical protein Tdes44962_MAKER08884 [Teratosphaeria destructans]|uniref:Uncharacterized protein n=1 Tax=Teratosphaeria destructans TaxID=418781 RepID=A0A9W7SUQ1_9PEZI|nr:hypothetical protein Tdes44962_MAKER08884 [Teratosphaeria destructans]